MQLGLIAGQSNEDYHAGPGISNSGISLVLRSPAHYYARYLDPNREPQVQTPAMAAGTALHCAILEPAEFERRYMIEPQDAPRRPTPAQINAAKPSDNTIHAINFWANFEERAAGRILLSMEDYVDCQRCAAAAHQHPTIKFLLGKGHAEQSVYAKHPGTGLLVKCRPDYLAHDGGDLLLLDLKTTDDARPEAFARSAWNYGYHRQSAFYPDVLDWSGVGRPATTFLLAIERTAPYAVAVYEPDAAFLERGRESYERGLALFATCLDNDEWPGYDPAIVPLSLPAWSK